MGKLLVIFLFVILAGCGVNWRVASFEVDNNGKILPASDARAVQFLSDLSIADAGARTTLRSQGNPDYVLVEHPSTFGPTTITLAYLNEDRLVVLKRIGGESTATVESRIPDKMAELFDRNDRDRLTRGRGLLTAEDRAAQAEAARSRAEAEAAQAAAETSVTKVRLQQQQAEAEAARLKAEADLTRAKAEAVKAKTALVQAERSQTAPQLVASSAQERPAASWKDVSHWQGTGTRQTEPFEISAHQWRINWETSNERNVGFFQLLVKDGDGKLFATVATKTGTGKDTSEFSGAGSYFLLINSSNIDWTVSVDALQ